MTPPPIRRRSARCVPASRSGAPRVAAWLVISAAAVSAAHAAAPAPAAAAAGSTVIRKSLLDYIAAGGEIGYIIIVLSLVAVGLIIAQLVSVRLSKLAPPWHVERLDELLARGDIAAAVQHCRAPEHECVLTQVLGDALVRAARSPLGFIELPAALEEIGQQRLLRLYRLADGVGLIGSIAPMLGLLGTVVGMVGAFDTLSVTEGPVRPDTLSGNISVALITTVLGLIVAIPCTAMHSYLRHRIDALGGEVAQILEDLASRVHGSQQPTPQPVAAPRPMPQSMPQPMPQSMPQGMPQGMPQPVPQPRPVQAMPHGVPHGMPQPMPQPIPAPPGGFGASR